MVKKLLVAFFFLLTIPFFLALPKAVLAHVLKTDGPIGAVLHIDPDDDPIVGQESHFYFDFKAQGTSFNVDNCSCLAKILENNTEVYSQALTSFDQDSASAHFSFTFSKKGVYQVVITGNQEIAGSNKNFKLPYDLRLERGSAGSNKANFLEQYSLYFVFGGIFVIFLLLLVFNKSSKNKKL